MIDAVASLQTNVIATVRRERPELPSANNGLSEQARQQSAPFVLNSIPAQPTRTLNPLDDQIAELMAVAQASAQASAGIEPKASQTTAYGRATAAYAQMTSYNNPKQSPLLSLSI